VTRCYTHTLIPLNPFYRFHIGSNVSTYLLCRSVCGLQTLFQSLRVRCGTHLFSPGRPCAVRRRSHLHRPGEETGRHAGRQAENQAERRGGYYCQPLIISCTLLLLLLLPLYPSPSTPPIDSLHSLTLRRLTISPVLYTYPSPKGFGKNFCVENDVIHSDVCDDRFHHERQWVSQHSNDDIVWSTVVQR
jgi:hypothetical protein